MFALGLQASAVSITNNASADTSLIEIAPTNNNGAQQWVLAGRIQNAFFRNRGLFKFDLTDLPTNTIIRAVSLSLEVTHVPDEPITPATFGLHRMLRPWGEGNKNATGINPPGRGLPADPGEATWLSAFFSTNNWAEPGGAVDVDYSNIESTFQEVSDAGVYRFSFTPELAADVQEWVNHPESNYGWMLLCDNEDTKFTARRFGSREDPNAHPNLELDFVVPPRVDFVHHQAGVTQLGFTPWPGEGYAVEYRNSLSTGNWQTLTNIGYVEDTTPLIVTDPNNGPQRFYRLTGY